MICCKDIIVTGSYNYLSKYASCSGVPRILFRGGGGVKIFLKTLGYLHSEWQSHAFGWWVWGHAPLSKILKIVQFGEFWRIFC